MGSTGYIFCAALATVAVAMMIHIILFVERHREEATRNYLRASDLLVSLPMSVGFVIVHVLLRYLLHTPVRKAINKKAKWSIRVYEAKVERCCSALFKAAFFVWISTFGYFKVLRVAAWTPPALGGTGATLACWGYGAGSAAQAVPSEDLVWLYVVATGYHLSEVTFQVMFDLGKPDFVEMMVHHIITVMLVVASFLFNYVHIGTLVMFIHDVSDIPGYLIKITVDTRFTTVTFCLYLTLLVAWGYFRLYCFPRYILASLFHESQDSFAMKFGFLSGLSLLLCLHIFWYTKFLHMGYTFFISGETQDTQANLSSMDLKQAKKMQKQM